MFTKPCTRSPVEAAGKAAGGLESSACTEESTSFLLQWDGYCVGMLSKSFIVVCMVVLARQNFARRQAVPNTRVSFCIKHCIVSNTVVLYCIKNSFIVFYIGLVTINLILIVNFWKIND